MKKMTIKASFQALKSNLNSQILITISRIKSIKMAQIHNKSTVTKPLQKLVRAILWQFSSIKTPERQVRTKMAQQKINLHRSRQKLRWSRMIILRVVPTKRWDSRLVPLFGSVRLLRRSMSQIQAQSIIITLLMMLRMAVRQISSYSRSQEGLRAKSNNMILIQLE